MNNQSIVQKLQSLPINLQEEVIDFIEFLLTKYKINEKLQKNGSEPEKKGKRKSNLGSAKGLIVMADDFDEPLEDFKDYM